MQMDRPAAVLRPVPRPRAARQLICFSYSGGGTATFRPWAAALPQDVELVLVCYPGREGRYSTPPAQNWHELMADVTATVRPLTHRPYVLFGHSLGAWVAFEVTAWLERVGATPPEALVVSAAEPPVNWHRKRQNSPSPDCSDEELLTWMRNVGQLPEVILAEPDLCQMAVDLLRADMRVSRSYRYLNGVTVRTPMQVLSAMDDPTFSRDEVSQWQAVAAGPIRFDELPGDHFYTADIWARLTDRFHVLTPALDAGTHSG
jgi:surfactin synthase thioesterase subunit